MLLAILRVLLRNPPCTPHVSKNCQLSRSTWNVCVTLHKIWATFMCAATPQKATSSPLHKPAVHTSPDLSKQHSYWTKNSHVSKSKRNERRQHDIQKQASETQSDHVRLANTPSSVKYLNAVTNVKLFNTFPLKIKRKERKKKKPKWSRGRMHALGGPRVMLSETAVCSVNVEFPV